jgi:hypothetical protein
MLNLNERKMITETTKKSEGKCLFCGKICTKVDINRHLQTHLKTESTGK